MPLKHSLITLVFFTSLLLPLRESSADIGEITINGEVVPDILFTGFSNHNLTTETRCPPTSDFYVRDIIVIRELIILEAEKNGFRIADNSLDNIEEFAKELEYLGPDGDITARAKAELLKHMYTSNGYLDHFPSRPAHDAILKEYKRLIKAKDPRFTDVTIVRHTPLEFTSEKDALEAVKQLQAGVSLKEVTATFPEDYHAFHYADFWSTSYDIDNYTGDPATLKTGTAVSLGGRKAIYFNEVKFRSRLRPFTSFRNSDNYVYKEVSWDLQKQNQKDRNRALWNAADVREDGVPIEMTESYPVCGAK